MSVNLSMANRQTAQKIKFYIKDFFKCDQIRSFLQIWSNLLKKSLTENFIFLCSASSISQGFVEWICAVVSSDTTSVNSVMVPLSIACYTELYLVYEHYSGRGTINSIKEFVV